MELVSYMVCVIARQSGKDTIARIVSCKVMCFVVHELLTLYTHIILGHNELCV